MGEAEHTILFRDEVDLDDAEQEALKASADAVRDVVSVLSS